MTTLTQDGCDHLIQALAENTRALEDVQLAVLMLTQQLLQVDVRAPDHRPIEEQGRPVPTIQRDAE